jgi:hypothetical protein
VSGWCLSVKQEKKHSMFMDAVMQLSHATPNHIAVCCRSLRAFNSATKEWRDMSSPCKGKLFAMKTYREIGDTASSILYLGTGWKWVASPTPWLLYLWGKRPQYQLNKKLGGPQSRSWHLEKEINLLHLPQFEPWIFQSLYLCEVMLLA